MCRFSCNPFVRFKRKCTLLQAYYGQTVHTNTDLNGILIDTQYCTAKRNLIVSYNVVRAGGVSAVDSGADCFAHAVVSLYLIHAYECTARR